MFDATTTYTDLDAACVASGHYQRKSLVPIEVRRAVDAHCRAVVERIEIDRLFDRGIASHRDLLLATQAEFAAENVKRYFTDAWWIEVNIKAQELEAFRHGEIGYCFEAGQWQPHPVTSSADETE